MQKLFFLLPSIAKKRCLKALPDHETSTSIKKRVTGIIPSNQFCPDLGSSSYWLKICLSDTSSVWNLCARSSDVISRGNQWSRHEMASIFLDKKWGGYFFFDRRIRRQRLERKRKNSKKVFSNVFLWVFTLTSGSRRRLCFCGVKNVKSNPGPGYSKQG